MVQDEDTAEAAVIEEIAQELIDLGYRPAKTASYIAAAGGREPMKLVAPATWAAMRELLATPQSLNTPTLDRLVE